MAELLARITAAELTEWMAEYRLRQEDEEREREEREGRPVWRPEFE